MFLKKSYTNFANIYICYVYLVLKILLIESLFLDFRADFQKVASIMMRDGLN